MKAAKYFFLVLFLLIWLAGCSSSLLQLLYKSRIIPDDYAFGDLYRITSLSEFKDPREICPPYQYSRPDTLGRKRHLYILGDSFAEPSRVDPDDFNVDRYQFTHWNHVLHLKLDTSAVNILILESVERAFRSHYNAPVNRIVADSRTFETESELSFMQRLDALFSSVAVEGRLDVILFYFSPVRILKEWKAGFTRRFFGRINEHATLSADGKDVVYYLDTDSTMNSSSFAYLSDEEVDKLVGNVNQSASAFRKMGFDKVFLSIIPNKATLVMPEYGNYNRLIERVFNHPELAVPYIDVLPEFKVSPGSVYLKGDSHWTCEGQYIWLEKANRMVSN